MGIKMTLTKAIEAAREAFQACVPHIEQSLFCIEQTIKYGVCGNCGCVDQPSHDDFEQWKGVHICDLHKAKATLEGVLACCKNNGAALPDKPMTEMNVKKLIAEELFGTLMYKAEIANKVFSALKSENVLYVEDK